MLFGVAWYALSQVFSAVIDVLGLIPFLGGLIALASFLLVGPIFWLAGFVIWALLIYRAFGGGRFSLPVISGLADQFAADDGPNARAALAYVLGPITGFVLLQRDRDPIVRYHAWQSIILFVAWIVVAFVIGILSVPFSGVVYSVLRLVGVAVSLGFVYFWLTALTKAGNGERFEVPYVGPMAQQYASR
jgi:uncharacterized membrane protein